MSLPEKVDISEGELKFPRSCCIAVVGPSSSGKMQKISEILLQNEQCFSEPPIQWFYFYNYWQPKYLILKEKFGTNITFIRGWHTDTIKKLRLSDRTESDKPIGIVIYDLAEQLNRDRTCLSIFSGQVHHKGQ